MGKSQQYCTSLFLSDESKDVVFTFQGRPEKIKAHKLILADASPVFHAMFYGLMKEHGEVHIVDIDLNIFEKMINFLYGQPVPIKDIDEAFDIQAVADKYDICGLVNLARGFYSMNVDFPNSCRVYDAVGNTEFTFARKKCIYFFENFTKTIITSYEFLYTSSELVAEICSLERITDVTELDLYFAVEKWLNVRVKEGKSFHDVLKTLQNAIGSIRFLLIPAKHICQMKLLPSEDKILLISNIPKAPFKRREEVMVKYERKKSYDHLPIPNGYSNKIKSRSNLDKI